MQGLDSYEFARYRLIPAERLLLRDGEPVALTPKAFDLLVVLVRRAGKLVDEEELLREVWPGTLAEEPNISQNVFALRRALGDDLEYVETVPKRGYRFVAPLTPSAPATPSTPASPPSGVLPPMARARPRSGSVLMIGMTVLIVGLSAVALYMAGKIRREARASTTRSVSMTRLFGGTHIPSAVISPDGRYVAHVVENGDQSSILIRQVSTIINRVVVPADPPSRYVGLRFSPDGHSLYFVKYVSSVGTALYRVPALGGTPTKVIDRVDSQIGLSPDGKRIAFVRDRPAGVSTLVIVNADGTGERVLAERAPRGSSFSSGGRGGPSWSPDGTMLATGVITRGDGPRALVVTVSVTDGKERPLTTHPWYQVTQSAWLPDGKSLLVIAGETSATQIWEVAYPAGTARRILTDLDDCHGLSITADARALATIRHDLSSTTASQPDHPGSARKPGTQGRPDHSERAVARGKIAEHVVLIRNFR